MKYHVLPGDAQAKVFSDTGISGDVIVFREAFVSGPIDAAETNEFWDRRASHVLSVYGDDEIAYQEKVADEILKLESVETDDEVNLWFEFELFCSVNLWYCLFKLRDSGARLFRVAPINLEPDDVWKGFGEHGPDELRSAFETRIDFSPEDINIGAQLWQAYCNRDETALRSLGSHRSASMPFLKEVSEAAAVVETRPREIVREIRSEGLSNIAEIFPEFQRRGGVFGFGDLQVERLLDGV